LWVSQPAEFHNQILSLHSRIGGRAARRNAVYPRKWHLQLLLGYRCCFPWRDSTRGGDGSATLATTLARHRRRRRSSVDRLERLGDFIHERSEIVSKFNDAYARVAYGPDVKIVARVTFTIDERLAHVCVVRFEYRALRLELGL
jgi:hypothetical protein